MDVPVVVDDVIYRLIDDVTTRVINTLPVLSEQKVQGEARVAQTFDITIRGRQTKSIAGCRVTNGTITNGSKVKIMRKGEEIHDGRIDTLKHVKKDVQSMIKGSECGISLENFEGFEEGDIIQVYEILEKRRQHL